jgi:cobalt/nickel transport system permease protein
VPLLGVTAAFVFAAQMLNFPVAGGTSGHFLGAALAAILLGPWLGSLVLAVVLAGQALVFADGGVTALGANVLNMGVLGALAVGGGMLALRRVLPRRPVVFLAVSAVGAWAAVMLGALATSLELAASGTVPASTVLPAMLGVHALIGVGEAVVTVAALSAIAASRPDLIWARHPVADLGRLRPAGA